MKIYHVTTEKKAKLYHNSQSIHPPVRGFDTLYAAMAWAIRVGRKVIYEFEAEETYLLPDHHNSWGKAYWTPQTISIKQLKCIYSPEK